MNGETDLEVAGGGAVLPPHGARARVSVFERLGEHLGAAGGVVAHRHPPGPAAHRAVLDILLQRPTPRIETQLVGLAAVRTDHDDLRLGGTIIAGREVLIVGGILVEGLRDHRESAPLLGARVRVGARNRPAPRTAPARAAPRGGAPARSAGRAERSHGTAPAPVVP